MNEVSKKVRVIRDGVLEELAQGVDRSLARAKEHHVNGEIDLALCSVNTARYILEAMKIWRDV